jgi:hypothetical protein
MTYVFCERAGDAAPWEYETLAARNWECDAMVSSFDTSFNSMAELLCREVPDGLARVASPRDRGSITLEAQLPVQLAGSAACDSLWVRLSLSARIHAETGAPSVVVLIWPASHLAFLQPTPVPGAAGKFTFNAVPLGDGDEQRLVFEQGYVTADSSGKLLTNGFVYTCPWNEFESSVRKRIRAVVERTLEPYAAFGRLVRAQSKLRRKNKCGRAAQQA